jgi:hypothetical protein
LLQHWLGAKTCALATSSGNDRCRRAYRLYKNGQREVAALMADAPKRCGVPLDPDVACRVRRVFFYLFAIMTLVREITHLSTVSLSSFFRLIVNGPRPETSKLRAKLRHGPRVVETKHPYALTGKADKESANLQWYSIVLISCLYMYSFKCIK